jgi:uncharacterized protein YegP (UPF0339 family)
VKLELFKGNGLQPWYLRLRGANGAVLAVSEGYFSKWNAKRAAAKNFPNIPLVDLTE